jgi:hypothetical protein
MTWTKPEELTKEQEQLNKLWRRVDRLKNAKVNLTITAEGVAELLRIAKHESDEYLAWLKKKSEGDPFNSGPAMLAANMAEHWTTPVLRALHKANGKLQVQSYTKAYNVAAKATKQQGDDE